MFDLFRSREKTVRYVLGFILGVVALSMVITLIPGYGTPSRQPDQIVAEVGKEPITVREVQMQLQQITKNRQVPPELINVYLPQLIDQMIAERALAYQAKRMGFEVTDADTALTIRSILPNLFADGKFNKQVYEQFLAQQGMSVQEFESNIEKQVLLLKLRNIALEGVVVTKKEVEDEYRKRHEQAKIDYAAVDLEKLKSQVKVDDAALKSFFQANRGNYNTNEKRSFDLIVADEQKIASTIDMPEAEVRRIYDQNKDKYRTPERVHVRHILVKTTDVPKDQIGTKEAKANDILKQLKAGADFGEVAKKNSDDPGSAQKGGDLDWVVRGQTVKPFEDAAFSLPAKQLSGLVKTDYGFHILQVLEKENARLKPFEEVKNDIISGSKKQVVYDRMQQAVDQARTQLMKNPANGDQIAKSLGLQFISVQHLEAGKPIPEIGPANDVMQSVGALTKNNDVTPTFQAAPGKLAVAVLRGIEPVHPAEFAEVENKVRTDYINQKAQIALGQKVQEATQKFKAPNADFKAVAKELGLEVKTTPPFQSEGAAEGVGSASALFEAFLKPAGTIIGPVYPGEKPIFYRVDEKTPADMTKLAGERDDIVLALKKKKANERRELFEDGLMNQLMKEGKVKKYPETIKRLESAYRG